MELDALRDPQRLAAAAKRLGMVPPAQPAFIRLDGTVLGKPAPATPADAVRINPLPSPKPASLQRKTVVIKVRPTTQQPATGGSAADTRGSSTGLAPRGVGLGQRTSSPVRSNALTRPQAQCPSQSSGQGSTQ